jgi:hypothetical protein
MASFDLGAKIKRGLRTPTYWVVVLILGAVFLMFVSMNQASRHRTVIRAENADRRKNVWPAERAAVEEELRTRQATSETTHETTIDLQPYINAQLSESTDGGPKGLKENNLLELPAGTHVYGGVPFDVEGRIQLMGQGLQQWKQVFPVSVKDIKIGRKCGRIYLFHGENCNMVGQVKGQVARLVLHYADGSERQIFINSGEHLLDWWGAIYKTGAINGRRFLTSTDSELAWVGTNPWIKRYQPDMSLRLYKSTLANPQPDLELETIDYVSAMSYAAPFMVGLTVE